jgi:hypothetical protein
MQVYPAYAGYIAYTPPQLRANRTVPHSQLTQINLGSSGQGNLAAVGEKNNRHQAGTVDAASLVWWSK